MEADATTLTAQEVSTIRSTIRAGRALGLIALVLGVPWLIELAAPVVGMGLLAVILLSPVLVTGLLVLVARKSGRERRQAAA